jgi:capsular polysaccharide biosynthesis protein
MNAKRSPGGIVRALRSRGRMILTLAFAAMTVGGLVSLVRPKVYEATAHLEVGTTGGLTAAEFATRSSGVRDRILSREGFDAAAARLGLDLAKPGVAPGELAERREAMLARLRQGTSLTLRPTAETVAIATLTCRDSDPEVATHAVTALSDYTRKLTFDQPVLAQEKVVAELSAAAKTAGETHAAAAKAHADYCEEHKDVLGGVAKKLQATREQKKQLRDVTIAGLEQQRRRLDELLAQEKQYDVISVRQPDPARLANVDGNLSDAREHLRQLTTEQKKPDSDPEVARTRVKVTELEDARRKLIADSPLVETRQPSEQYAQLSKARSDAQSQLDAATRQLKIVLATEKEEEEIARRTPEFEAKAATLAAAAAATQAELDTRAAALSKAENDLEALRAHGTLSISVTEEPRRPDSPSGPGAALLAFAGLAAGALAGAIAAVSRDRMDRSFRETEAVSAFLGVPTLGAVDVIRSAAETAELRKSRRRASAAVTALAVFACLVFVAALLGGSHLIEQLVKSSSG